MDIEELLKEGPSLTLTPEAAPELPAEEKKAEPKVYEEEQYLTEEEKHPPERISYEKDSAGKGGTKGEYHGRLQERIY